MTSTEIKLTCPPRVSVVVPTFNAASTVQEALQSILDTKWPNLEVVVIDDGSTDETREIVNAFAQTATGVDIRLLRHSDDGNHGPSATRNLGIKNATGEYVCFLDADDLFFPDRIESAITALESDSSLDAVFGLFQYIKAESDAPLRDLTSRHFQFDLGTVAATTEDPFLALINGKSGLHTSTVTIQRPFLHGLGGFPIDQRFGEDQAFWLRLLATGNVKRIGAHPVTAYRIHVNSLCSHGQQSPEFAIGPVLSRIDALRWLRHRKPRKEYKRALEESLVSRLLHRYGSLDASDARTRRHLWRLMWTAVGLVPRALLDRRVVSILAKGWMPSRNSANDMTEKPSDFGSLSKSEA